MGLSIADIDKWSPEAISAVGAAGAARADAASQAGSRMKDLSAFKSWQGAASDAAQARTQLLAFGLDQHGQAASTVVKAANTAANEVRQIKNQLSGLRGTLGQYGILVDADGSRAVPPPNLSSMSAANRNLVQDMTVVGQHSLDKIRQAADQADALLADALKTKDAQKPPQDDFDLDTQFVRAQGVIAPHPESGMDCVNLTIGITGLTTGIGGITLATHSKYYGCGSGGKHCKL